VQFANALAAHDARRDKSPPFFSKVRWQVITQARFLTLGLVVSMALAVACSDSKKSGGGGVGSLLGGDGTVDGYCSSYCQQSHDCDKSLNEQTCTNSCKNGFAAVGPKLREDFLNGIATCVHEQDCATVLDGKALAKCNEETTAVLSPSSVGKAFCEAYEQAVEKCEGDDFDKAECFEQAKSFNDAAIQAAQKCLDDACSDIDACVAASLGEVTAQVGNDKPSNNGGASSVGGASSSGGTRMTLPSGGSAGIAGGTNQETCVQGDPSECVDSTTLRACGESGVYELMSCADVTASIGFDGTACSADKCDPGGPRDAECMAGTANYCACVEGGCNDDQALNVYLACYLDDPAGTSALVRCFGELPVETAEQCAAASQGCAAE
jgi:hypothetical protein